MKDKDIGKNGPKDVKGAGVLLHRPESTAVGVTQKAACSKARGLHREQR